MTMERKKSRIKRAGRQSHGTAALPAILAAAILALSVCGCTRRADVEPSVTESPAAEPDQTTESPTAPPFTTEESLPETASSGGTGENGTDLTKETTESEPPAYEWINNIIIGTDIH